MRGKRSGTRCVRCLDPRAVVLVTLNPPQKIALEIGLRQLERTLLRLMRQAREPAWDGPLIRTRPMPARERTRLESVGGAMIAEIEAVAKEFGLQAEEADLDRVIDGELSVAWAYLNELLAKKMVRYGTVDPELPKRLDPHIHRLIRLTREVERTRGKADKEQT